MAIPDNWRVLHARAKTSVGRGLAELDQGQTRIVVSESDIGNPGAILIADALLAHTGVINLNLAANRIDDAGAIRLAEALQGHKKLQVLCLSFNSIGDKSAKALARLVESHPTLRLVNLDGNRFTDVGISLLLGALATNPRGNDICIAAPSNPVKRISTKSLENLSKVAATVKTLATRGVTLGQLLKLYGDGCANGTIEPETTTTSDVALDIVLPASAPARQSYVEAFGPANASPTTFVIHAWNGLFRDLLRAVASHATRDPNPSLDLNDPLWFYDVNNCKNRSYFIDVFSVNQHATMNKNRRYGLGDPSTFQIGDAHCQIDKFHLIAEQIQQIRAEPANGNQNGRVMIVVDYDNLVLSRILCLKEVHQAILSDPTKVDVNFCRLPSYPYDKMFTPAMQAKASCNEEKDQSLEEIENDRGGQELFDKQIMEFLTTAIAAKYAEKIQALMPKEILGMKKESELVPNY